MVRHLLLLHLIFQNRAKLFSENVHQFTNVINEPVARIAAVLYRSAAIWLGIWLRLLSCQASFRIVVSLFAKMIMTEGKPPSHLEGPNSWNTFWGLRRWPSRGTLALGFPFVPSIDMSVGGCQGFGSTGVSSQTIFFWDTRGCIDTMGQWCIMVPLLTKMVYVPGKPLSSLRGPTAGSLFWGLWRWLSRLILAFGWPRRCFSKLQEWFFLISRLNTEGGKFRAVTNWHVESFYMEYYKLFPLLKRFSQRIFIF